MKKNKKILIFITLALSLILLASCSTSKDSQTKTSKENSVFPGWNFSVVDVKLNTSLEDISTSVGYGGEASTNKISAKPKAGNSYLLIKILAEKKEGTEVIAWDKMLVKDSNGNTYSRMEDSFLEDYGFKRMKGTPLNFGSNEGWIAYEVPSGAIDLKLNYTSEAGTMTTNLELK